MKKLRLKKWVKNLLITIFVILVIFVLIHFILSYQKRINNISNQCDEFYGRTCSWYEIENFKGQSS